MDVLYDPNNPDSEKHADTIINLLSNGVGSVITLTGNKISSLDLPIDQLFRYKYHRYAL